MNVLIVFAHPEPQSLNASLRDVAITQLQADGHDVQVSDLYAENWKAVVDRQDFPGLDPEARLVVGAASARAYFGDALTADVKAEQDKLRWADAVIFQFPLWWFSMPAILKGWFERVYALGFAYGVGEHSDTRWGDRYGEGTMAGKRAMLIVTAGGWPEHYGARAINGPIDDLLFPINHGTLHYPGFDVLPAHVIYRTSDIDAARFDAEAARLRERLRTLETEAPIAYRKQNFGDYRIPQMQLREGLEAPGDVGFALHIRKD
ncbi:MAG TPA: NAD(P)H-dependent oxidoreductase [Polymorphobacter sp.]|nr:NAD(P)H-dependent oxidoreductase [Polymorphobacter sp.]